MTEKERADGSPPSKDEKVLTKEMWGIGYKDCDSDLGCGEPDASGGWRQEYRHQKVVAAVPHPEA